VNANETQRMAILLEKLSALCVETEMELRCDWVGKESSAEIGVFADGECLGYIEPTPGGYELRNTP
jgi:hypothetical protein